ncbi:MAG: gluconokinase [Chloroflexi bacterium]|nr:gluconokinase [Chloroflexota bacterium]
MKVLPAQSEPPYILAIDIGTSAVRAMLFDRSGRLLDGLAARRSYTMRTASDGTFEIGPDFLLDLIFGCVDDVLSTAGPMSGEIRAVAISTLVSNVLGVDVHHRPLTPMIAYADTRSAPDVFVLRATLDERLIHQRTGCYLHTSYLPARFLWLARTQPEVLRQAARWVSIGEYLFLRLFGQAAVSYSVASWTGLLDIRRLVWDEALLEALPIGLTHLSPLTDVNVPQIGLRSEFAKRWPSLAEVPWFPALGDGAAADIGCGCVSPRRVALTMGSTVAMRLIVSEESVPVPWGLWCYRVDRRRLLLGGALNEGGIVYVWMQKTLRLKGSHVERALAAMPPDSHGLTVLPFWAGERSPGWSANAQATIHGLTLNTTPLDILRASLEAIAYRIALVYELLADLLPDDSIIIAGGVASRQSPTWVQIIADVLNQPIAVSEIEEVSGRGAALLALESLGVLSNVEDAPGEFGATYVPDLNRHMRYRAAIERQRELYAKLVN